MFNVSLSTPFVIALFALDLYAIFKAVFRAHGVERTLAWIFAIIAFPVVGALAYILLASPSVRRTTRRKRLSAAAVRKAIASHPNLTKSINEICPQASTGQSMLHLTTALTGITPTTGNEVELLADDDKAFEQIANALKGAQKTIWAEYYIIRNDETGHRFLDMLTEQANKGVEVRLLYDAVGSLRIDAARLKAINAAGGMAEVFLPVNPLRRRWSIHLRNHRKIIIVDGEIGFTGGMNVGDEYSGRSRLKGGQYFRDSHLALRGPVVGDLAQTFAEDWSFATREAIKLPERRPRIKDASAVVAVVPSGPDQKPNANGLTYFTGISSARRSIFLTSPYFIPDEPTLRAMISAAMRGLDVRLLLPERCDIRVIGSAARSYYPKLIAGGVRVYEYRPSMLHAKTMVVDRTWSLVGSANVDIRSFRLNFEFGAMVVDAGFAEVMEQRFREDLEQSREITVDYLASRSRLVKIRDSVTRLLSPLL